MTDTDCVNLLQWALPQLGLDWSGFRKVRGQVCKRIARRARALGLELGAYRSYLEAHPEEWAVLEPLCRVTISRFYRDRGVWELLAEELAERAAQEPRVAAWSIGCGAGEEPYTLRLVWAFRIAPLGAELSLLATDIDPHQIERAHRACYPKAALRELPPAWQEQAFAVQDARYCLRPELAGSVELCLQDIRRTLPDRSFDLILCRNVVFTYFDEAERRRLLEELRRRLVRGGLLVLGRHERLPDAEGFVELAAGRNVFSYGMV
jgi:chemotaxis protein methyltransferase CheR